MKDFKYSGLKTAVFICILCVFVLIVISAISLLSADSQDKFFVSEAAVSGIAIGILLFVFIVALYYQIRNEFRFFASLINNFKDIAYIRYDKHKKTAVIQGNINVVAGISVDETNLKENDYNTLIKKLFAQKHSFEVDIYTVTDGAKWYRLSKFSKEDIECTVIRDETGYIERISLINNLRYYDSLTGIFNKQAIIDIMRRLTEQKNECLAIVHFVITGIEKITSFENSDAADATISKLAAAVKTFETMKNIHAGRTASNEITVVISNGSREDYIDIIQQLNKAVSIAFLDISEYTRQFIKIYCGFVISENDELKIEKMMAAADFAAFDAIRKGSVKPVEYDSDSYEKSANEYKKIQIFNESIADGMIEYHYQPIINARTGDIYGYEALMRPKAVNGVRLTPQELVAIAKDRSILERIEFMTLLETLKIISENQQVFREKRLFVNSVSCITLADNEYELLVESYAELFPKLVIEITEENKISENLIQVLDKYFRPYKTHIALDDYGSGYSNEATLLSILPNYIKIDQSLIKDIHTDLHKQQLVSNIISFASNHDVYSLAEGVESFEELETVIYLGVDLIQGFVACRPVPMFMLDIAPELKALIIKYSIMHAKRDDRVLEVKDAQPLDLINLAVFGYTDIILKSKTVNLYGNVATRINMRIISRENETVHLHLENVYLQNDEGPVITLGDNSEMVLSVEGENTFGNQGIRVPDSARLRLIGNGNLNIECSHDDGICIGGNSTQTYGDIKIDGFGNINLVNKCDRSVCIGGGIGVENSCVSINSGRISISANGIDSLGIGAMEGVSNIRLNSCYIEGRVSGNNVVGIGSIYGNSDIKTSAGITLIGAGDFCSIIGTLIGDETKIRLNRGDIKLDISGSRTVGIGSAKGHTDINSNADVNIVSAGDSCCCIGTLIGEKCSIRINDGNLKMTINAKELAGIGSVEGNSDITLTSGVIDIMAEGSSAVCIGNLQGSGEIRIANVVLKSVSNSGTQRNIMTNGSEIFISAGNIYTNSLLPIEAKSPNGSNLVCQTIKSGVDDVPISINITENDAVYRYTAKPTQLFEGSYLYLPEGFNIHNQ